MRSAFSVSAVCPFARRPFVRFFFFFLLLCVCVNARNYQTKNNNNHDDDDEKKKQKSIGEWRPNIIPSTLHTESNENY